MKCNLATWDRLLRFFIGVILFTLTLAGGPYWFFVGLYLIFTAAWGICPLYGWFDFSTFKLNKKNESASMGKRT